MRGDATVDPRDGTWIEIGPSWRRVVASWDDARRARLLGHLRRLKAGGWNQKAACFVGYEMVLAEDEVRAVEEAKVGRRDGGGDGNGEYGSDIDLRTEGAQGTHGRGRTRDELVGDRRRGVRGGVATEGREPSC